MVNRFDMQNRTFTVQLDFKENPKSRIMEIGLTEKEVKDISGIIVFINDIQIERIFLTHSLISGKFKEMGDD